MRSCDRGSPQAIDELTDESTTSEPASALDMALAAAVGEVARRGGAADADGELRRHLLAHGRRVHRGRTRQRLSWWPWRRHRSPPAVGAWPVHPTWRLRHWRAAAVASGTLARVRAPPCRGRPYGPAVYGGDLGGGSRWWPRMTSPVVMSRMEQLSNGVTQAVGPVDDVCGACGRRPMGRRGTIQSRNQQCMVHVW